jgi:integrase
VTYTEAITKILTNFTVCFTVGRGKGDHTVKTWTKTRIQNLMRHRNGLYYARFYSKGKEQWIPLKTELFEVAKARLREHVGEIKEEKAPNDALTSGRMTFGEAAAIFLERLKSSGLGLQGRRSTRKRITESSIHYREQTVKAILKSWPELATTDVRKISETDCEKWSEKFASRYSATRFNNTLDSMRHVLGVAIKAGARHGNPAESIGRREVRQKIIRLPEQTQFQDFVKAIETAGAWCSRDCANFVRLLAFTGCRKNEAANLLWSDVDFERGRIHLRVTKNGKPRYVPLIPDARSLLEEMKKNRSDTRDETAVVAVREAQKAMDHAAAKIGMSRITHHDLRHLFATQCIEAGIDIPTVSRWLGHVDGGALAMKVYGHLRDSHSAVQAQKVSFSR